MKYKFALNDKVKGYIEWQLVHYHEDKKQLEEYKADLMPSVTPGYSQTGGIRSGVSNPTERNGLMLATNPYILTTERNIRAISRVLDKCTDSEKTMVDLVYWKQSYTISGAGKKCHYGKTAAYEHINDILCRVALEMGLVSI